jgi:endonuclease IV
MYTHVNKCKNDKREKERRENLKKGTNGVVSVSEGLLIIYLGW